MEYRVLVLPVCREYGIGVIPWSPLANGWLSGRYRKGRMCRRAVASAACHRIDEIVPPGRNNPVDAGYTPPAIADPSLRRRAP
ncbi:MAG TPA: aldo/keto reductase [Gaiellaceae bacterium]|jgi:aryl-alcohol dehydrogenase-like predicted oxidoreductase